MQPRQGNPLFGVRRKNASSFRASFTGLATLEPELEDVLRVLGARRIDVLLKVGLPRSMPFFFASLKVAVTLAFAGPVVISAMAMAMYEFFAVIEKRTTEMDTSWPAKIVKLLFQFPCGNKIAYFPHIGAVFRSKTIHSV